MPYRAVHTATREARAFYEHDKLATWLTKEPGVTGGRELQDRVLAEAKPLGAEDPLTIGPWEIHLHGDPAWKHGGLQPRSDGTPHDGGRVYDTDDGQPAS